MVIMLFEENGHGFIKHMHVSERRLLRAFALVMQYLDRQIPILKSAFQKPIRQVNVFTVHEKGFVQEPRFFQT